MAADVSTTPADPPLTTGEVARRLRVNRSTVTKWANSGALPFFTLPSGQRRFHAADIDAIDGAPSKTA